MSERLQGPAEFINENLRMGIVVGRTALNMALALNEITEEEVLNIKRDYNEAVDRILQGEINGD